MADSPRVVYVSAPQGAGKTANAAQLQRLFGCSCVVDEWDGVSAVPEGALVLTNRPWPTGTTDDAPPAQGNGAAEEGAR